MIGEEPDAPCRRPPLSKDCLPGKAEAARLQLRPAGWYAEARIDLRCGIRAGRIDRAARRVLLPDGSDAPYDALALATGAAARALPGAVSRGLSGVPALRGRADGCARRRRRQAGCW